MAEPFFADDDAIIERLGVPLLRELDAIAACCDAMPDGKMGLYAPGQRQAYRASGDNRPLVQAGCVALGNSYVGCHKRRMPNIRMAQTGRRILRRARALGIDLEAPEYVGEDHFHGE